jgi:hypothetical protein
LTHLGSTQIFSGRVATDLVEQLLRKAVHDWSATGQAALDLFSEIGKLGLVVGGDVDFGERAEGRRGSLVPPVTILRRDFTRIAAQLEHGAVAAQ